MQIYIQHACKNTGGFALFCQQWVQNYAIWQPQANGPKKVAASRMQTSLILPKLHAAGSYPGSICMRQAAKWQRRALPLAARCKLNLYVTGCRLGTLCMRLAAAIC